MHWVYLAATVHTDATPLARCYLTRRNAMTTKRHPLWSALLASLVLAGCGTAPQGDPSASATANGETTTAKGKAAVCLVSGFGGLDDQAFNQSAHEGLQEISKELGITFSVTEPQEVAEYQPSYDAMVQEGCGLLIGMSYLQSATAAKVAQANPDLHVALVDSGFFNESNEPVDVKNGRPLEFDTVQAAYLAGYASAAVSKSRVIGTFGGTQEPPVIAFMDGYAKGAAKWNEDHPDNPVQVLGWDPAKKDGTFAGTYEDIAQGKTLTTAMFSQGADIVMPVAGSVGQGAAAAAKEKSGTYVVWVDSDGFLSAPEYKDVVLTSVIKDVGASVKETVRAEVEGKFSSSPYIGTLENGGVRLAPFHDHDSLVPADVKTRLTELEEQIKSGELKLDSEYSPKAS